MQPNPDFVVVGGRADGKVFLLASKSLRDVELRVEREFIESNLPYRRMLSAEATFITAEIRDYVYVMADSYEQAFATLFNIWSPEMGADCIEFADRKAIDWKADDE